MADKLYVTFLWHQHQPYYGDVHTGRFVLPWVRLHAVKDYIGMGRLLAEFPRLRQVINFVPSLIRQIDGYLAGETDDVLVLARTPADSLSREQAVRLLRTFFMANWESMIKPHPRYRELFNRCNFSRKSVEKTAREFTHQEFRDLQVWANLTHFHPTIVEQDDELRRLIEKDRDFTEEEKGYVLDRQFEVMRHIVPEHRRLAESGQLELITSPFYHPILPLLCNPADARVARPELTVPPEMQRRPEDAAVQVERALAAHEETFGRRPRGMWPPEGSVSDEAAKLLINAGVNWVATDEEILARTLGTRFSRDPSELVQQPDVLYRPCRLVRDDGELAFFFRDHLLSDLIGFRYHLRPPEDAAKDLMSRLDAIRKVAPENGLAVIALDGENCWEYYPDQGVGFLRNLYQRLSDSDRIETITPSEYLDRFGAGRDLDHIFPGSWITHSFTTWVGHWEKNRAWEFLTRARNFHAERSAAGDVTPDAAAAAMEELYIAEGSDWFWWYGDDHSTPYDAEFDAMFRGHLQRSYELLGATPPDQLLHPIAARPMREVSRPPRSFVHVRVDGRRTSFFEWLGAGLYKQTAESGAMQRATPPPVAALEFGFSSDAFFLALELTDPERSRRVELGVEVWLAEADGPMLTARFSPGPSGGEVAVSTSGPSVEAACDRLIEIGCPRDRLGVEPGETAEFCVRVFEGGRAVQRLPGAGSIPVEVPGQEEAYPAGEDLV